MDMPKCKICGLRHRIGPCPDPKEERKAWMKGMMAPPSSEVDGLDGSRSPSLLRLPIASSHRDEPPLIPDAVIERRTTLYAHQPICPKCETDQVQLIDTRIPAGWKCRHCHHTFESEPPRKRGPSYLPDRERTLSFVKPWLAKGISRATWYRREQR